VIEPVLLLHGYDSRPSALGDLADRLGERAELVAGFEDLTEDSFAWWLGDLSPAARKDLTEYLEEISFEANRALRSTKVQGLAGMLTSKSAATGSNGTDESVVVVGFSQGAATALSWLLDETRQTSITMIVAVAGFLPDLTETYLRGCSADTAPTLKPVQIHLVHLSNDEVVDAMVSERVSRLLTKAGFSVTDHHIDGSHTWSSALTDLVVQLLGEAALTA
jgi:predicted esterase